MKEMEAELITSLTSLAQSILPPKHLKNKVMQSIRWLNEQGEMLGKVDVHDVQTSHPFNDLWRQLEPGTGRCILTVRDKNVSNETNYSTQAWDEGIESLKSEFPVFFRETQHGEVLAIHVMHGFDPPTDELIQEMWEEAIESGTEYIIRPLQPNQKIVGIQILYKWFEHEVLMTVLATTKSRIHLESTSNQTADIMDIGQQRILKITLGVEHQYIWSEEYMGKYVQYDIRVNHLVTQQEMSDFIQQLTYTHSPESTS